MRGVHFYPFVQGATVYPLHFNAVPVLGQCYPGKDFTDGGMFKGCSNLIFPPEHPPVNWIVFIGFFKSLINDDTVISVSFEKNTVSLRRLIHYLKVFSGPFFGEGLCRIKKAGRLNHALTV